MARAEEERARRAKALVAATTVAVGSLLGFVRSPAGRRAPSWRPTT
jgi:hypothetical protein